MAELLLNAGDEVAQELLAHKHDPLYMVYRIHPNYLRALVPTGLAGAP